MQNYQVGKEGLKDNLYFCSEELTMNFQVLAFQKS